MLSPRVQIVLGAPPAEELVRFWLSHRVLDEAAARARLPSVVAVVRDGQDGAIVGSASAVPAEVGVLGGRLVFVLRSFLAPAAAADASVRPALERAVYTHLDAATGRGPGRPLGLCLVLSPEEAAARPDARWSGPAFVFAGHLEDGRQVRVAWFGEPLSVDPARPPVTEMPAWEPGEGPLLLAFAEQDEVGPDDVVAFWLREGAMPEAVARDRVGQVLVVALDDAGGLAGVTTAYLDHDEQLGSTMWHVRVFVAASARGVMVGIDLVVAAREELTRRWTAGDRRAPGVLMVVSHWLVPHLAPNAWWIPHDFWFVGETARGDHLRVHWFAGAPAPVLAQGRT